MNKQLNNALTMWGQAQRQRAEALATIASTVPTGAKARLAWLMSVATDWVAPHYSVEVEASETGRPKFTGDNALAAQQCLKRLLGDLRTQGVEFPGSRDRQAVDPVTKEIAHILRHFTAAQRRRIAREIV